MAYTVLARRYRSQQFSELVGQEAIVKTLQTAVKQNRVAHAYLFTGTRGVGKTSSARLFARALNAVDEKGKENAEVAEAIMKGQDTDTIEIDAASNNSVEEARNLIANAAYRPLRGRKKVYIIDEVHMLSTAAFNALLKTMEEPPEHVVFILCTTETHKVPATIQSRCQRFDFRPIPTAAVAAHLGEVLKGEKVKAEPELLHMVARLGNGSMRDALSLMDRLLAAGEKTLTVKLLEDLLGLPDRTLVANTVKAIAAGDTAGTLTAADALTKRGVSPEQLLSTLADRFRDLMILAACGEKTDLVELEEDARAEAVAQAAQFDAAGLTHLIAICDAAARSCRTASNPRAIADAAIVRMSLSEKLADVAALVAGQVRSGAPRNGALPAAPAGAAGKK
ncbi:MAG TPA: DNA polymerase III subunit gamma/tau [Phycisphaerales bacterium]|nr:DNA polymerase III subunit gamma/tau [Phycisphaerales bacterium]